MTPLARNMTLALIGGLGLLLWLLQPILTPFVMATALAYLGDPLVDRLEQRGMSRTVGVSVVFLVLTSLAILVTLLLVPLLIRQIETLREGIPQFLEWIQSVAVPWISATLGVGDSWFEPDKLRALVKDNLGKTAEIWGPLLKQVSQSGLSVIQWSVNIGLVPVVTFYLLRDWDHLVLRVRRLIPRSRVELVSRLARECDDVLSSFVRGQLLVMLALGLFYMAGLALLGLKLALLIGLIAGLAGIVPYLGFVIGIGAAAIAAIIQFGDAWHLFGVIVVFGVGQALESMLLTPLLVGDRIGLHPVAVIFAVLAGGQLFGFVGILLALPAAAVIMVLVHYGKERYLESEWYLERALETEDPGDDPGSEADGQ